MAIWNKEKDGPTEDQVLNVLKRVQDPDLHKDIVTLGFIRNLKVTDGNVAFDMNLTTPACPVKDQMRDEAVALVKGLAGVQNVDVKMTAEVRQTPGRPIHHTLSAGAIVAFAAALLAALRSFGATAAPPSPASSDPSDLTPLARLLFSDHLLSFEALSILLLAALVGAFALARREGSP